MSIEVAVVGEAEVFLSVEARVGLNPVLSAWPCSTPFMYSLLPRILMSVFGVFA